MVEINQVFLGKGIKRYYQVLRVDTISPSYAYLPAFVKALANTIYLLLTLNLLQNPFSIETSSCGVENQSSQLHY